MRLLLKDGVKYLPYEYKDESELEQMVVEHSEGVFGEDSLFLYKQRMQTLYGTVTIPDGFVLFTESREWCIVEVELASHPLYDHIVTQIMKFLGALQNPSVRKKLVEAFFEQIRLDYLLKNRFESAIPGTELHKFLSDVLDKKPLIAIVIDKDHPDLKGVCESLPSRPSVSVFETYARERAGLEVHVHSLDALGEREPEELEEEEEEEPARFKKRFEFWQQLLPKSKARTPLFANKSPTKNHWVSKGAGRSGFSYDYVITTDSCSVELYIDRGKDSVDVNKRIFDALYAKKGEIEKDFGESLEWERLDGKRASRISWECDEGGLLDEQKWDYLQNKMIDAMIRLEKALTNRIKALDI
jgi:hypothetical protein